MRSVEVRKIQLRSAVKAALFASAIPMVLMLLFLSLQLFGGSGMAGLAGAENGATANEGVIQGILFLVPLLLFPVIMSLCVMLFALSYNLFAAKFGGLKITIGTGEE